MRFCPISNLPPLSIAMDRRPMILCGSLLFTTPTRSFFICTRISFDAFLIGNLCRPNYNPNGCISRPIGPPSSRPRGLSILFFCPPTICTRRTLVFDLPCSNVECMCNKMCDRTSVDLVLRIRQGK